MATPEIDLARELEAMARTDQIARRASSDAFRSLEAIDRQNTARLREIVDRIGWPSVSKVGREGAHWAWLLVQHADQDPAFQKRCLELMKALLPDDVSPTDVAYLEDRVRVREGRPQLYGTQFSRQADGTMDHGPVEDPEGLDARRAVVGMMPIDEYRKGFATIAPIGAPSAKRADE